jgi:periplasmic divalent cation tolerance protein
MEILGRTRYSVAQMTDKIVVLSSCETELEAVKIARHLIDKRVAACVNIISKVRSIYRWKDAAGNDTVEDNQEFVLMIKTRRDLFPKVRAEIASIHSYKVPEIIALPIVDGADSYLAWLDREFGK